MKALRFLTTIAFIAALFSVMSLSPPEVTANPPAKVTMCHLGKKTLQVNALALAAHLQHGDTIGACP